LPIFAALVLAAPQYGNDDSSTQYVGNAQAQYGDGSAISAEQWASLNPYGPASYYPADEQATYIFTNS
jgi:hypothetical protein